MNYSYTRNGSLTEKNILFFSKTIKFIINLVNETGKKTTILTNRRNV